MRILVYGLNKYRANEKLQEILDNLKYGEVEKVIKSCNEFKIYLKNGDMYQTITASDTARGQRWQYAYIEKDIDSRILNYVIFPTFRSETANLKDSYEWY